MLWSSWTDSSLSWCCWTSKNTPTGVRKCSFFPSTLIFNSGDWWYDLQMGTFITSESDGQSQLNVRSQYLSYSPPETRKTSSSWDSTCLLNRLWHVKLVAIPFKSVPCWVYDDLLKCVFEFPLFQQQQRGRPQVKGRHHPLLCLITGEMRVYPSAGVWIVLMGEAWQQFKVLLWKSLIFNTSININNSGRTVSTIPLLFDISP